MLGVQQYLVVYFMVTEKVDDSWYSSAILCGRLPPQIGRTFPCQQDRVPAASVPEAVLEAVTVGCTNTAENSTYWYDCYVKNCAP